MWWIVDIECVPVRVNKSYIEIGDLTILARRRNLKKNNNSYSKSIPSTNVPISARILSSADPELWIKKVQIDLLACSDHAKTSSGWTPVNYDWLEGSFNLMESLIEAMVNLQRANPKGLFFAFDPQLERDVLSGRIADLMFRKLVQGLEEEEGLPPRVLSPPSSPPPPTMLVHDARLVVAGFCALRARQLYDGIVPDFVDSTFLCHASTSTTARAVASVLVDEPDLQTILLDLAESYDILKAAHQRTGPCYEQAENILMIQVMRIVSGMGEEGSTDDNIGNSMFLHEHDLSPPSNKVNERCIVNPFGIRCRGIYRSKSSGCSHRFAHRYLLTADLPSWEHIPFLTLEV